LSTRRRGDRIRRREFAAILGSEVAFKLLAHDEDRLRLGRYLLREEKP